jgi:chromosome segregation ATPase
MQAQEIDLKGDLQSSEARIAELEQQRADLQTKLEAAIQKAAEAQVAAKKSAAAPTPNTAELEKLKTDNAAMKKKLMAAENAIEQTASLKAKVARLEAQLKK